jgi:fatty-acyl-CoA synthase
MNRLTPTTNPALPVRLGAFATLAEGLDYAARGITGFNFFSPRGEPLESIPYAELRERARELATRLASGFQRLERIALVAETSADFVIAFFACQYAGLIPLPLPLSMHIGGREAYVRHLRGMLKVSDARLVLAPPDLVATLTEASHGTGVTAVVSSADVAAWPRARAGLVPLAADEPCCIQYSSGSTSFPRGVVVTQRAITANARAIAMDGLAVSAGDRGTSWLPFYHDMGLIGYCLTPALTQISVDYLSTSSFARRPLLWLELISRYGGTISFSPSYGYDLCIRRAERGGLSKDLDLRQWRVAGVGGEVIRPAILGEFAARFAPVGFQATAFVPSYGLAEATLAVSFARLGRGMVVDRVAQEALMECEYHAIPVDQRDPRPARSFVVCGRPMPGYAVEIRNRLGRALPERRVGRICIKGPSLMSGYYRDEAATAKMLLDGGWLDTGDMGYLLDGDLVVTGRSKDLIIVGGRNIWPQDVEWAIEQVEGVRAGYVAAFAVTDEGGQEHIVVVVGCRSVDAATRAKLRAAIAAMIRRTAGIDGEVVLARPGTLPYTTSGKLSRAGTKAAYLAGAIPDVAGQPETAASMIAVKADVAAQGAEQRRLIGP